MNHKFAWIIATVGAALAALLAALYVSDLNDPRDTIGKPKAK